MRMNPVNIVAFDLPSVWYEAVKACMLHGYERPVFRGARKEQRRKELDWLTLQVRYPANRPIVPDVPDGIPPPTSMDYVNKYLAYIATPYKQEWEDYTYGERSHGVHHVEMKKVDMKEGQRVSSIDFNQMEVITRFLKETPETNRAIIEVGKPEDLVLEHPPCLRLMHFKIRYGELHLGLLFRSWDVWGGLPSNLAAYQLLKESMVKELNEHYTNMGMHTVVDGEIFASSMGAHVYSGEWELARKLIERSAAAKTNVPKVVE